MIAPIGSLKLICLTAASLTISPLESLVEVREKSFPAINCQLIVLPYVRSTLIRPKSCFTFGLLPCHVKSLLVDHRLVTGLDDVATPVTAPERSSSLFNTE